MNTLSLHPNSQENIAIGRNALNAATQGDRHIAIGSRSMELAQGTGRGNIALGYETLVRPKEGNFLIGIGYQALGGPEVGGVGNIAIGSQAMYHGQ